MAIFLALVALCLSGSALAHLPSNRGCPAVTTQSNFDVNRYLGTWYVSQTYSDHQSAEEASTCTVAEYSRSVNGLIHVVNYYRTAQTGRPATLESYLRIPNRNDASKMKIRYPDFMPLGVEGDYYVLASDYDTYAVVYNCAERRGVGALSIWILTREQNPAEEIIDNADAELERIDISRSILRKTEQTNC